MAWKFDPNASGNSEPQKPKAGKYWFSVEQADETTFKSGNAGMKIKLSVAVSDTKNIPVFYNVIYLDGLEWKMNQLLQAVGIDPANQPENGWEPRHIEGKSGWATFAPQGEKGYLGVEKFCSAPVNNGPDAKREVADAGEMPF